jgi:hypothetical protein
MIRFVLGAGVGAFLMYSYLTGQIPWRDEVERWFSRVATSYTAVERKGEADGLIAGTDAPTTARAR